MHLLAPIAQTQAATQKTSVETFDVSDVFDDTTNTNTTPSTDSSYTVPVYSKDIANATPVNITGTLTPDTPTTYTIVIPKDISLVGQFSTNTDSVSRVYASLNSADGTIITNVIDYDSVNDFSKKFVSAGTYTLTVDPHQSTGIFNLQLIGIDASKNGSITVGSAKNSTVYVGYNNNTDIYKKFKVTKNSCVAITAANVNSTSTFGANVTICNSSKKAISPKSYTSSSDNFTKFYGLKKGTYYVKLNTYGLYTVKASYYKSATVGASSRSKAKRVTSKAKNYILPASTSKSSIWYKYTFKKPAKKTLTVSYIGDHSVKVTVYKGKKQLTSRTLYNGSEWKGNYVQQFTNKEVNWPKGTYHIKVQKNSKADSGLLQIKMK